MGGTPLADLVERCRRLEAAACEDLVRRFQNMALGYAQARLGDWHAAEDAVQEAFLLAFTHLDQLGEDQAFPGWLRRILHTTCDRIQRRRRPVVAWDQADGLAMASEADPGASLAAGELRAEIRDLLARLSAPEREAATLFYLQERPVRLIAAFLEVPESTVKNRLLAARRRLKERMSTMFSDALRPHALDERFSRRVVEDLLARPRLLAVEGHPVRQVVDLIASALDDYQRIDGDEIVAKEDFFTVSCDLDRAFHVDEARALRSETTTSVMLAARGRQPPVRLWTAGRVFRPDREDASHRRMFHQLDVLAIAPGLGGDDMRACTVRVLQAAMGAAALTWRPSHRNPTCYDGHGAYLSGPDGKPVEVAGCGMFSDEALREFGFDPRAVTGFGLGVGLERLAMLRHGITDIADLYRSPYLG